MIFIHNDMHFYFLHDMIILDKDVYKYILVSIEKERKHRPVKSLGGENAFLATNGIFRVNIA